MHFRCAKIEVPLRQAVAATVHRTGTGFVKDGLPFHFVGAIIDRPENTPLNKVGIIVRQSVEDIR